ncbi:MAG TPA: Ig-like domain repeat protein, partial [Bryobacteraceae bacterium]
MSPRRSLSLLALVAAWAGLAWGQTALSLSSSPNPSAFGQTITLTVTSNTQAVPAGSTINFIDVSTVSTNLGSAQLDSKLTATLTTSALAVGTHSLQATF